MLINAFAMPCTAPGTSIGRSRLRQPLAPARPRDRKSALVPCSHSRWRRLPCRVHQSEGSGDAVRRTGGLQPWAVVLAAVTAVSATVAVTSWRAGAASSGHGLQSSVAAASLAGGLAHQTGLAWQHLTQPVSDSLAAAWLHTVILPWRVFSTALQSLPGVPALAALHAHLQLQHPAALLLATQLAAGCAALAAAWLLYKWRLSVARWVPPSACLGCVGQAPIRSPSCSPDPRSRV